MQGAGIPDRVPLEVHWADEHLADGIFAFVAVDLSKLDGKPRRVNIAMPSRLLAIIDEAASPEGYPAPDSSPARHSASWTGERRGDRCARGRRGGAIRRPGPNLPP